MATLYLHLGMGKTGSSFLQSVFARNVDLLSAHGIEYPLPDQLRQQAASGQTTSGNRARLSRIMAEDPQRLLQGPDRLFSNETMSELFLEEPFVETLTDLSSRGLEVRLLMFIRDPAELLVSSHLQKTKERHRPVTFEQFARNAAPAWMRKVFMRLHTVITLADRHGWTLDLHNYSRVRRDLTGITQRFLQLPAGVALETPARIVNRSIGAMELGLNRGLGDSFEGLELTQNTNYLRRLVDATATLRVPSPSFPEDVVRAFLAELEPDLLEMNAMLPEAARYGFDIPTPSGTPDPYGPDYGERLAREVVRATLLTLERNLDPAGQIVVLRQIVERGLDADVSILRRLASLLIRARQPDEALRLLEAHDPAPHTAELLTQRVTCLTALDRVPEAVAMAEAAFAADPAHRFTAPALIAALIAGGDTERARDVLGKLEASGTSPERIAKLAARIDGARAPAPKAD